MYSISNIESSLNVSHFAKMNQVDFENYIIIYEKIKRFEEIYAIKKIAIKNSMDILNYEKEITQRLNNNCKIFNQEIHDVALEFIIRAILLNQTFIENVKVYIDELSSHQKQEIKKWINKNEKLQFLRILRNYTYHNTIPVSTSKVRWNVLLGKYEDIKFILSRDKLINNMKKNNKDIRFITKLESTLEENINIIAYFKEWIDEINFLYDMILKYVSENLKDNIIVFNSKFHNIFISTNGYVVKIHEDRTYDKYIIDKYIFEAISKQIKV